jgi:hypothetical protein
VAGRSVTRPIPAPSPQGLLRGTLSFAFQWLSSQVHPMQMIYDFRFNSVPSWASLPIWQVETDRYKIITGFAVWFVSYCKLFSENFKAMEPDQEVLVVAFTRAEAMEIFQRCLRSVDEDTAVSEGALQKLARLIGFEAACRRSIPA